MLCGLALHLLPLWTEQLLILLYSAKAGEGARQELYHQMDVTLWSLCNGWRVETLFVSLSHEPSHFGVAVSWKLCGSPVYTRVEQRNLWLKTKAKPPAEVVLWDDVEAATPASRVATQPDCSMSVTLITCRTEHSTPVICCSSVGSYLLLL